MLSETLDDVMGSGDGEDNVDVEGIPSQDIPVTSYNDIKLEMEKQKSSKRNSSSAVKNNNLIILFILFAMFIVQKSCIAYLTL